MRHLFFLLGAILLTPWPVFADGPKCPQSEFQTRIKDVDRSDMNSIADLVLEFKKITRTQSIQCNQELFVIFRCLGELNRVLGREPPRHTATIDRRIYLAGPVTHVRLHSATRSACLLRSVTTTEHSYPPRAR
jgi:hypothetical protein